MVFYFFFVGVVNARKTPGGGLTAFGTTHVCLMTVDNLTSFIFLFAIAQRLYRPSPAGYERDNEMMLEEGFVSVISGQVTIDAIHSRVNQTSLSELQFAFAQAIGVGVELVTIHLSNSRIFKPWVSVHESHKKQDDTRTWIVHYDVTVASSQRARILRGYVQSSAFFKILLSHVHKLHGFGKATLND